MIRTKLKRMLAASLCAALCLSSVPVYAEETPNGQTEVQTDTMQEDVQQDGTEEGSSLNSETSEEPEESQDMTSEEETPPAESQDDVQEETIPETQPSEETRPAAEESQEQENSTPETSEETAKAAAQEEQQTKTEETERAAGAHVVYRTHVQDKGWLKEAADGALGGTVGEYKRMEAIEIKLEGVSGGIQYRSHIQKYGWENGWKADGTLSGTEGEAKRLEAIQIRLTGEAAEQYDVYYRVHAQDYGWLGWAKNGENAGTSGKSKRLEAIQIQLVDKGGKAPGTTENAYVHPLVNYSTHVQTAGWQSSAADGAVSGTVGKYRRLEGIKIRLDSEAPSGNIEYRTHIQNIGWEKEWKSNGTLSGTTGKALRLEAIQIRLSGEIAEQYDVYYRVHAQNYGWLDWAKNGESAGTSGLNLRLEAIQIQLVKKGEKAPGKTDTPYVKMMIRYMSHVQDLGWENYVNDGAMSGTKGKAKRLEAIKVQINNADVAGEVEYRTHVQNLGWENKWTKNGAVSGSVGKSLRLEALQIRLTGTVSDQYDLYYRVHVQDYGWLDWAKNGEIAGTTGLSKRMEAIEIQMVEKGAKAPGSTDHPYITTGWGTKIGQIGDSTSINIRPNKLDQLKKSGKATSIEVTAAMKYRGNTVRQVKKEVDLNSISSAGFNMNVGYYGKYYVSISYKKNGKIIEAEEQIAGVKAGEYNLAPVSASFPVVYFSLSLWDITTSPETGKTIPTIVMLDRPSAYNWDQLPEGVYGMPYLTDEQMQKTYNYSMYAQYVKDLYEVSPDSRFNLYINDITCTLIHSLIYANRIPDKQYTITMMSDGSGTFNIMNKTYNVADPSAKHQQLINEWKSAKQDAYETGKVATEWGWHKRWDCMYAVLACEPGTEWWVARNNLFTSGDNNAFAEKIKADVTVKNVNTMLQDLQAKGEGTVNAFKALYDFNDGYFAESEIQNKKSMMLLGTYAYNEETFENYARLTMLYYGDEYVYYYKGHPNTPTGMYPAKQEQLERLGMIDVDSSVAAELILFFNPEISMSGYSSSTFNSASREMACGLFSSTKSEALGQAGSIDYSGIDWFASVIDPDNVDSRIAALCPDGADCYLLEFSDEILSRSKYDIGIFNADTGELTYYGQDAQGNYIKVASVTE